MINSIPWDGIPENWGKGNFRNVPICELVQLARNRQIRDLIAWKNDPNFPYYYDEKESDRVVWFFQENLVFTKGRKFAGNPFILEDWQEFDVIRPLFGWRRKSDGTRRFRKFLILVPRKNGKSALISGIGLYGLIADCEPGAEIYCAATKEEQAKIVFNECKRIVKRSPTLKGYIKTLAKNILCEELDSVMKPLGRDSDTEDGLNTHFGLIDEYHAHKTNDMYAVLDSSTGARDQPLLGIISTAGFNSGSPCLDEQKYCERILRNEVVNDEYYVYITQPDNPEDWTNPIEWQKANPMLGLSLKIEDMESKSKEAQQHTTKKVNFLVKHLNIWQSAQDPWIKKEQWKACESQIDWSKYYGQPASIAVDLGRTRDLSAVALSLKTTDENGEYKVITKVHHLCPEDGIRERGQEDGANYPLWSSEGYLEATPGAATRSDYVRKLIHELAEKFDIQEIGIDRWTAADLSQQLTDDGFNVVRVSQTVAGMAFACQTLEELIVSRRLQFEKNPLMDWQISHVTVFRDGNGNMKIMKPTDTKRVDGVVALAMSVGLLTTGENQAISNPYSGGRGIYVG